MAFSSRIALLCRDCTVDSEAVQYCVSPKIAAKGSMNALARYRGEEASHRLTRNAVVFFSQHHAIFSEQNLMQIRRSVLSVIFNCKQMRRTEKAHWT